jgi:hypothetical protein
MRRFNLFVFFVMFFFLFSCAGTPKGKNAKNDEQITENVIKQPDKNVKETEKDAGEKKIELEDFAGEEQAEITKDKLEEEPFNAEIAPDEPAEEAPNAEMAQAGSGEELPENAAESLSAEPAQLIDETPSVSQAAPEQAQPDQTQPPPIQPSLEERTDVSETDTPDSDSQFERESSPSWITSSPIPATRIESLTQMGTMPYDNEIIFSRIIYAAVGQIVEIPFRGRGWVYLEEIASRRGAVYNSQRNDADGQSFIFTLEAAGTYVLKFYRRDFIRDYILNDHVQLIVEEAQAAGRYNPSADRDRVVAQPRWPSAVEEAQIRSGTRLASEPVVTSARPAQETPPQRTDTPQNTPQRPAAVQETNTQERTPSQNTAAVPSLSSGTQTSPPDTVTDEEQISGEEQLVENREKLTPEAALQKARQTFDGGNVQPAIEILNQLMEDYPDGSDEVYWLLGQYYEANSPARNILLSLDYYRRLVKEYPQSNYFNDARRRIAYLERFYINIQ